MSFLNLEDSSLEGHRNVTAAMSVSSAFVFIFIIIIDFSLSFLPLFVSCVLLLNYRGLNQGVN